LVRRFRAFQIVLAIATSIWLGQYPAEAQPRSAAAPRQAPALPESGHQTEAIDLNEGKTAPQMFASDCAVCHQKPNGLAKGRSTGQLANFLRQHYTTGTQQAGMLSAYLTSGGMERGTPAPAVARDAPERPGARERGPVDRPPAAIGGRRQSPDADDSGPDGAPGEARRKPAATEASKPADREAPASRRQSREREEGRKPPSERKPAASARAPKPAAPDIKQSEAPATSTAPPETPAAAESPAPPAEEKPAAPPPPPAPEIRI
jgi:hypothetical protein